MRKTKADLEKENAYLLKNLSDANSMLEAQRKVSSELSIEVSGLKEDRGSFKRLLDRIGEQIRPGFQDRASIQSLPDEVRRLVLEAEYQRGAAEMALAAGKELCKSPTCKRPNVI